MERQDEIGASFSHATPGKPEWLALTARRAGAGLSLRKPHVLPWKDGPEGWRVVFWPNLVMKGKRPHALPIPPRAVLLVERALAGASRPDSEFVLPSVRKTGKASDTYMTKSSPGLLIARLRGRPADTTASEDAERDETWGTRPVLAGIPHFTPHDMRRTFATTLGDLAVRGDAVSAVLDHTQDTGIGGRFVAVATAADITRIAYDYSQRLELKRIAVEAWTDALFSACDAEWESHWPKGLRVARVPGAALPAWVPWYREAEAEAERRVVEEAERVRREREARGPVHRSGEVGERRRCGRPRSGMGVRGGKHLFGQLGGSHSMPDALYGPSIRAATATSREEAVSFYSDESLRCEGIARGS